MTATIPRSVHLTRTIGTLGSIPSIMRTPQKILNLMRKIQKVPDFFPIMKW